MEYCFSPNGEGWRVFCLVGGRNHCVLPPDVRSCEYHLLDEEDVISTSGQTHLRLVSKIEGYEVMFYFIDADDKEVGGPYTTRQTALLNVDKIDEEKTSFRNVL